MYSLNKPSRPKALKVLHAPGSVGGHPQALSRALRKLCVESSSLVVSQNYLSYSADVVLHWPGESLLIRELKRIFSIVFFIPRFDVIHYNSGTTIASAFAFTFSLGQGWRGVLRLFYAAYLRLLQRIEIFYVRLLGKTVFVTYSGDDARQADYCLAHFDFNISSQVDDDYYCSASDAFKRRSIKSLSAIANGIYSMNPDLLHVLPGGTRFTPYAHVFMDEWLPSYTQAENRPLRILHAPTNRRVKGTELILTALDRLRDKGFEFEILLVEGMSNADARKVYESADVLIDQLFAGWYGGLAVELMALGKPVMAYLRDVDLAFIPNEMRTDLPLLRVTPPTVEEGLREILQMPRDELVALGKRSRAFVERWHDPLCIAQDILVDYKQALKPQEKVTQ